MFYKRSLLSNGIRVITEEMVGARSVSVGFWVHTGSRREPLALSGISHFIEHMNFKGTKKRSTLDIARLIDSIGGNLNAFTSRENTCFSARVLDEHLDIALDLLSDIAFHSVYDDTEIAREKAVISEEISMYEDSPEDLVHDLHIQNCWPEHPLGHPTLGTNDSISGFDSRILGKYFDEQYTPQNIVITAAGKLDHQHIVDELERLLGGYNKDKNQSTTTAPNIRNGQRIYKKKLEQAHICLGTNGVRRASEEYFTFVLLSIILGGGMSSRLFQRVREREALAYSIFSYLSAYLDAGLFVVYAGVNRENFNKTVNIILEEFKKIKREDVPAEELERAKQQFKGAMILGLESSDNHMSRLAKLELYHDKFYTMEQVIEQLTRVTAADVRRLANEYLTTETLTLTCLADIDESEKIELLC